MLKEVLISDFIILQDVKLNLILMSMYVKVFLYKIQLSKCET